MASRLGTALVLIGVIMLGVFLLGLSVQQADPLTLVGGAALAALGLLLRRRAPPPPPSGRFRTLRRALGRGDEPPEEEDTN